MIFIIRMHILFSLILVVLCAPPPIYRGLAFLPYLWYFRFCSTRYRLDRLVRRPNRRSQPAVLPKVPPARPPAAAIVSDHRGVPRLGPAR
jgi:hypothetical protein